MSRCLIVVCTLLSVSTVWATNETPFYPKAFFYEPYGQDSALQGLDDFPHGVLQANGYTIQTDAQSSSNFSPSVTAEDFVNALTGEYGVGLIITHGDASGPAIEVFPASAAGSDSAYSRQRWYLRNQLFSEDELFVAQAENGTGWSVCATALFISRTSREHINRLVFLVACQSTGYLGSFKARWAAGVAGTSCTLGGIHTFFGNLSGQGGLALRPAGQAVTNTGFTPSGNGETVICPLVVATSLPTGATITGRTVITVDFDAKMDTIPKPVIGSDVFAVYTASRHWPSESQLAFAITGVQAGYGDVTIDGDGAHSATGGIKLNGGASYTLNLYSDHADNGAADVHRLRVDLGQLTFTADSEWETARYHVLAGSSLIDPLTEVVTIQASGGGQYTATVPPAAVYRLLEEETTGRQFPIGACEPDVLHTSLSVPPIDVLWLQQQIAQAVADMEPENIGPPHVKYVIFSTSQWFDELQPLIDYWHPKGYDGILVSTNGYPSDPDQFIAAVKGVMRTNQQQGVRLFQIMGTSNDYRQFFDNYQAWYTTPAWLTARQSQIAQGALRQPERDIFPTHYESDPAPRGQNLGYWRPYLDEDSYLADLDDDGVPDVSVWRLPVATDAELTAAVWQIIQADQTGQASNRVAILGNNWDAFGNSGALVSQDCEALRASIPASRQPQVYLATQVPGGSTITGRTNAFNAVVNGGAGVLMIESTLSNRYRPGDWNDLEEGFQFSSNQSGHRYLLIGGSCEIAGSNRSLDSHIGLPWVERGLTSDGGPCAVIGFNTGSLQGGDGLLAQQLAQYLLTTPSPLIADAALYAIQSFLVTYPSYAKLARTFSCEGFVLTRLKVVSTVTDSRGRVPFRTVLYPNWPNPFNPSTTLRYGLSQTARAQLVIYDAHGACVRRLVDRVQPAGEFVQIWDGHDERGAQVASGTYFVQLMTNGHRAAVRKAVLLK